MFFNLVSMLVCWRQFFKITFVITEVENHFKPQLYVNKIVSLCSFVLTFTVQSDGCVENRNLKGESFPLLIINLNLRYKHDFVTAQLVWSQSWSEMQLTQVWHGNTKCLVSIGGTLIMNNIEIFKDSFLCIHLFVLKEEIFICLISFHLWVKETPD